MSEERPCYVAFEPRAIENREKSIEAGHAVYEDEIYAVITPPGGNLVVDKVAAEWLEQKKRSNDPFFRHYKESFEAFLEDREAPVDGTPIEMWPAITPAQLKQIQRAKLRTVEDVRAANENSIKDLGMGGRALVQRAQAWLESAENSGAVAEQNAAMKAELDDQKAIIERLSSQIDELTKDKPKRGKKAA